MTKPKIELLIIDPQNDFCDPAGALYVGDSVNKTGACEDIIRLSNMITRLRSKIDDIHVTLDSHHLIHIAHPIFWRDHNGNHPAPFTLITSNDVNKGVWTTTSPRFIKLAKNYVEKLEKNNRYVLCIWPPHCLIGSWGHNIHPTLFKTLLEWEEKEFGFIDILTKGSNYGTEHYSAVQADVPDATDPTTMLNLDFGGIVRTLERADIVAFSGQALSHCVANSIRDIINNFNDASAIKKMVLLKDTMTSVSGFEKLGQDFINEMISRGMQVCNADDFLR